MEKIKRLIPALLVISSVIGVQARLHLGSRYLQLGKNPTGYVELWNSGSDTLYIQVDGYKYTVDDDKNVVHYKNNNPKELGLLYAPRKLVIKPGKKKRLRVTAINRSSGSEHQYYNLNYKVLKKAPDVTQQSSEGMSASVSIGILYQTLIDVGSGAYSYNTKAVYDKDEQLIKIVNTGNTLMSIGPLYTCKNSSNCKKRNMFTSLVPNQAYKFRLDSKENITYFKYGVGDYHGKEIRTGRLEIKK